MHIMHKKYQYLKFKNLKKVLSVNRYCVLRKKVIFVLDAAKSQHVKIVIM